ncbi:hypothetical protein SRHO_G00333620 [Serrasalmus rhombeus]
MFWAYDERSAPFKPPSALEALNASSSIALRLFLLCAWLNENRELRYLAVMGSLPILCSACEERRCSPQSADYTAFGQDALQRLKPELQPSQKHRALPAFHQKVMDRASAKRWT